MTTTRTDRHDVIYFWCVRRERALEMSRRLTSTQLAAPTITLEYLDACDAVVTRSALALGTLAVGTSTSLPTDGTPTAGRAQVLPLTGCLEYMATRTGTLTDGRQEGAPTVLLGRQCILTGLRTRRLPIRGPLRKHLPTHHAGHIYPTQHPRPTLFLWFRMVPEPHANLATWRAVTLAIVTLRGLDDMLATALAIELVYLALAHLSPFAVLQGTHND
jgi:hypothetical protein